MSSDFLVEILTEELPPKGLLALSKAFCDGITKGLQEAELTFGTVTQYASPRRIAVIVDALADKQNAKKIERQGPAVTHAFDENGNPTKAALGFARSCGTSIETLSRVKTDKGEWLTYSHIKTGEKTIDLLEGIVAKALKLLPIAKPMRWGNGDVFFVRPVHHVIMLLDNNIVPATILGLKSDRITLGHRFHHPDEIPISSPSVYEKTLENAYVISDFYKRREIIQQQINALAGALNASIVDDAALLDEVTNIVEWPKALLIDFDKRFLNVPSEVLITSMASHQKCFALTNEKGELLPHFITVSNIESQHENQVIHGNEKVMCARLSDAAFFYDKDKQTSLECKTKRLSHVVFQATLGSLSDKMIRIETLSRSLSASMQVDEKHVLRAVKLSKADLMSDMVGEFPSLQGVMGRYYAEHDKEDERVAIALYEQYLPRFSGDKLPESDVGFILALADRIDTLVGIFGINQKPTGMKDPFKCRRQALGIVRMLLDKGIAFDIKALLEASIDTFACDLKNKNVVAEVHQFIVDRLKVFFVSQGVRHDVVQAVLSVESNELSTISQRIDALSRFIQSKEASSLTQAFKRVRKLFEKENLNLNSTSVDKALFNDEKESRLFHVMQEKNKTVKPLIAKGDFHHVLKELALLKEPVDNFFDGVMVLTDDKKVRDNRLALLAQLQDTFLQVADLSELQ